MTDTLIGTIAFLVGAVIGLTAGAIWWRIFGPRMFPGCTCWQCTWKRNR